MKSILAAPWAYDLTQYVIRGTRYAQRFVVEHVRANRGDRVLDIGCGTGVMLQYLPDVRYVGVDVSHSYVAACRKRYGSKGRFYCQALTAGSVSDYGEFDLVLAIGLVHHLNDPEAANMFTLAKAALVPGGRLVTLDGVYSDDQSPVAKFLLRNDRGKFVRTEPAYRTLATSRFANVRSSIHHDLFRIPYTVLIMECTK
jgi:cyclopropane fatty-acyl-phospholipid synthase-like methyltransferase